MMPFIYALLWSLHAKHSLITKVKLPEVIQLSNVVLRTLLLKIGKDVQDKKIWNNDTSISAKINDNTFLLLTDFFKEINEGSISLIDKNTQISQDILPAVELHKNIYLRCKNASGIIHSHGQYTSELASSNLSHISSILDDMAQIIGPDLKILNDVYDINHITHCLKRRNAILINGYGGISVGRSIQEAFVTTQILEKSCHVYLKAQNIGGSIPVPSLAARIMCLVYKKKYSKNAF